MNSLFSVQEGGTGRKEGSAQRKEVRISHTAVDPDARDTTMAAGY